MMIEAKDFSFAYGNQKVFENASIDIARGSITGILGPNGAGKTTFFDLVSGVIRPRSGQLDVHTNKVQYLLQTVSSPNLKFRDIFRLMTALKGEPTTTLVASERLAAWSPELGDRFVSFLDKHPRHCSYGQIRCFYTLCCLVMDSELLILDEPTAGVDAEYQHYIWMAIKKAAQQGTTVLASSHYIEEIAEHCDHFYMISNRAFELYTSGEAFQQTFGGANLNQAFVESFGKS